MRWTHDLVGAIGLAIGVWLGSHGVGPVSALNCAVLGVLMFGASQLGERVTTGALRMFGRPGEREG